MSIENQVKALEKRVEQLNHELELTRDEQSIRKLQHAYGYYMDKALYEEVVDLFADDGEVRFMHGVFKGKAGARRLYIERFQKRGSGRNGPVWGRVVDHPMHQDIVTVAPDGKTAKARFRCTMQAGTYHSRVEGRPPQWWEGGLYENTYRKENGVWKIQILDYHAVWHGNYETGWAYTPPVFVPFFNERDLFPKNPLGPDAIIDNQVLWPDHGVLTFHFPHPVTGKKFKPQKPSMTPKAALEKPNPKAIAFLPDSSPLRKAQAAQEAAKAAAAKAPARHAAKSPAKAVGGARTTQKKVTTAKR